MQDTNPRGELRDAVLATLSANVDDADVQVCQQRRVVGVETAFVRDNSVGGADWRQQLTFIVPEE